jgi:hypothetical protein
MAVCLILPLLAVVLNLWSVRRGGGSADARFFRMGLAALVIWTVLEVVLKGTALWQRTAFTLVEPGLQVLYLQGFSMTVSLGAAYLILPQISGGRLPYPRLARLHFWLVGVGLLFVVIPFVVGGFLQGSKLADPGVSFTQIAEGTLMPIRVASLGQLLLILGHLSLAANVGMTLFRFALAWLRGFNNAPVLLKGVTEGRA